MTVGTIQTSILTDIANAIRLQAGVATTYKPREMAAVIAALDGTNAGSYQAQQYKQLQSGVLSDSVFQDIADAIRIQNGLSTQYQPSDMAQAILDLTWDVGLKPSALLLSDGTMELNYLDRRRSTLGGMILRGFEPYGGYSSATERPWESVKQEVKRVVIDSSFANASITNADYFFHAFENMMELVGFENMDGITSANQMFTSCIMLETIYATSFDNSGLSGSLMFNTCNRLVGGADGFVPSYTSGASVCKIGTGGVLTEPNADQRTWFYAHFYADGEAVLTATADPEVNRELLASGRICAIGKYKALGFTPWDFNNRSFLTRATFASDMATYSYLNLNYLFHTCNDLATITGLGNLSGVRSMRYTMSYCAVTSLDFRGFDPSTLTDLFYCFAGCTSLTTIYVDSTWTLPPSDISGAECFYGCRALIGGNGTAWSSSNRDYAYMRIDSSGQPGYLTAV